MLWRVPARFIREAGGYSFSRRSGSARPVRSKASALSSRKRSYIAPRGGHTCICSISVSSTVGRNHIPGRHRRHRMRSVAGNDSIVVLADHRSSEVQRRTQSRSERMPATLTTQSQTPALR
jgi:hypothetical protein